MKNESFSACTAYSPSCAQWQIPVFDDILVQNDILLKAICRK